MKLHYAVGIATCILNLQLCSASRSAENAPTTNAAQTPPQKSANSPTREIGTRKQLLADDFLIDSKTNITRRLGTITKVGPVVKPTLDSDHGGWFGAYHTVLFNPHERKFQLWYSLGTGKESKGQNPYRGIGYAESEDGLHWTKPLVSSDGKTNIVLPMSSQGVMIDPTLPWGHAEKFKATWMHLTNCAALAYSADGRRWEFYNDGKPVTGRAGDTLNQILWDPDRAKYILGTRTDLGPGGGALEHRGWRIMEHTKDGDLKNHPTAWTVLSDRIAVDDPQQDAGVNPPQLQFHHISMWRYEDVWFQLLNVWTAPKQQEYDVNDDQTRHDLDVSDFYLGASRDLTEIDRSFVHARQPLVPRGPGGSWDDDIVFPSSGIITRGDEHWLYYCGVNERIFNFNQRGRSYIGLAKLPLDRLIGQGAGATAGTIVTKPFQCAGGKLLLNVDAKQGELRVAVLEAAGKPIDGFGADSATFKNVDDLHLAVQWAKPLSELKGKSIRLKFELQNAVLYSLQIQE